MRSERGYTIVEALMVAVMLIVVLGGTLSLLDTTAQIAPQENERAHAVREAQVGLGFMVRELRQSHSVEANTATGLTVQTPVNGALTKVAYDCNVASLTKPGLKACVRTQYEADGVTVAQTSRPIDRLNTADVFTYTVEDGKVRFVQARIEVPASGERKEGLDHSIVLDDGFFLRNVVNG